MFRYEILTLTSSSLKMVDCGEIVKGGRGRGGDDLQIKVINGVAHVSFGWMIKIKKKKYYKWLENKE